MLILYIFSDTEQLSECNDSNSVRPSSLTIVEESRKRKLAKMSKAEDVSI